MPTPPQRRHLVVGSALATALVLALTGTAFAGVPDTRAEIHEGDNHVDVSTVCDFHLHFYATAADPKEAGYWEIWSSGGAKVLDGQWSVTPSVPEDRVPDTGTYHLPNGSYTLLWDNEPVDSSRLEKDFTVACESESSAPSESVAPTESVLPTESTMPSESVAPTESVLPTESIAPTESATGGVGGVVATPNITLPPTDTAGPAGARSTGTNLSAILAVLATVALAAVALVPRRLARQPSTNRARRVRRW